MASLVVRGNVSIVLPRWQAQRVGGEYFSSLLGGGQWQRRDGALEAFGGAASRLARRLPAPMRFDAITLGHVIIAVDRQAADGARCHEHVHIRQYERWGALFVPAYLAASVWQGLRGGAPYRDNVFEREAYAASPISSMPGACAGMGKVK